jgi:hypothetical protein
MVVMYRTSLGLSMSYLCQNLGMLRLTTVHSQERWIKFLKVLLISGEEMLQTNSSSKFWPAASRGRAYRQASALAVMD